MAKPYTAAPYSKVVVPITPNCNWKMLLSAAKLIVGEGEILLVGLVGVKLSESLSVGTLFVRQVRKTILDQADGDSLRIQERVQVSYEPWDDLTDVMDEEHSALLLLEWPIQFDDLQVTPEEVLIRPPCDIALIRGPITETPKNVLVTLRGSPYAEDALRLALAIGRTSSSKVTSLHVTPDKDTVFRDKHFRGLQRVLENLPEVTTVEIESDDPAAVILEKSNQCDLVVLGATARPEYRVTPVGPITERILTKSSSGVIAVKSTRPPKLDDDTVGHNAISILVDKWFAENTYHADEFGNLKYLLELKEQQDVSISLALPALNEEDTVGNVIQTIQDTLMESVPLLDEIVLMDSDSSDRTREIAGSLGVPVHIHQQVLPQYGARRGKGEALWKSLYVTTGDILVWIDTDIVNIHPRFVYGLLGPLLVNPSMQFVKGFYRRPLKIGERVQAGGGGRVTELTARPLLNLFYPELSGVVQPLSGEYGGRRSALEKLVFFSGYGVETGLLIDVFEKFGLSAIAQIDLRERIHHNQPLESLSKMSFAIIQVFIRKLEGRYGQGFVEEVNKSMKLIRYEPGRLFLEVEKIAELERPPMVDLPEYLELHSQ